MGQVSDPTLTELRDAFVAEVESELATDIPLLPVAVTRVLGAMYAAGVTMIRKLGNWNLLQQFAEFAEFNEVTVNGKAIRPLVALGNSWGPTSIWCFASGADHRAHRHHSER